MILHLILWCDTHLPGETPSTESAVIGWWTDDQRSQRSLEGWAMGHAWATLGTWVFTVRSLFLDISWLIRKHTAKWGSLFVIIGKIGTSMVSSPRRARPKTDSEVIDNWAAAEMLQLTGEDHGFLWILGVLLFTFLLFFHWIVIFIVWWSPLYWILEAPTIINRNGSKSLVLMDVHPRSSL